MKIALIAHDKKKDDIIKLAIKYKDVLKEHRLFATGTTGSLIMAETGLDIIRMKSGPLGGDQQIGSMIADGELDLVIFLRDPLTSQPHEPDVSALMRLCDVRNIPLATNKTSAAIMLKALSDGDIAEADFDHLFERFYKADRAHTGEGTGLGLAIAKEIMVLMGERIWAESKDGRVVFSFTVAKRQGTGTNTNKV